MMAKWYSGPWGPKASRHLSYRWGKPPKKPHPVNLSGPGIEPGPSAWRRECYRLANSGGHSSSSLIPNLIKVRAVLCIASNLPSINFNINFPTITPYAFLNSFIRATWTAHHSHLDIRFLIMLNEEYNACGWPPCNFLQSQVISSRSAPNILFVLLIYFLSNFQVRE